MSDTKKIITLGAVIIFIGWPILRNLASTSGEVRVWGATPALMGTLNSYQPLGGPNFVESSYIFSDTAYFFDTTPSLLGAGGFNNPLTGHVSLYPVANNAAEEDRAAHETFHVIGYRHSHRPGDIMNYMAVYGGTARLTAEQAASLHELRGITVIDRLIYWASGPSPAGTSAASANTFTAYAQGPRSDRRVGDNPAGDEATEDEDSVEAVQARNPVMFPVVVLAIKAFCGVTWILVAWWCYWKYMNG